MHLNIFLKMSCTLRYLLCTNFGNILMILPKLVMYIISITRLHRICISIMGQCVRFYNKIPENVRECYMSQFKRVVKRYLCVKGDY